MSALHLTFCDGLKIAVPPTLSAITTYVILEQERWFEKEINVLRAFLKSGMTAIDIGANLGVYTLPIAQLVGAQGRVFSYEPGGEARALLEASRVLNDFQNVEIIGTALSDREGEGHLSHAASSELRSLQKDSEGECVKITSLDAENERWRWSRVDFVKIDAEGEEERILAGGRNFFANQSPLVMFEIKAGKDVNKRLRACFPEMGYRVFRQLGESPILVPDDAAKPLDAYELNLFAAKPDRVAEMKRSGLLADTNEGWQPDEIARKKGLVFWRNQKFSGVIGLATATAQDDDYRDAIAAYAAWRDAQQPLSVRCQALIFAAKKLRALVERAWTPERASTWARVAFEYGARQEGVVILQQMLERLANRQVQWREPFWPANPRYDALSAQAQPMLWFAAATAEQLERSGSFSSAFTGASSGLAWLCQQPFASLEMQRRQILIAARAGLQPRVPEKLRIAAPGHLNAQIWSQGLVPGTIV